jgi:hypothetical protein
MITATCVPTFETAFQINIFLRVRVLRDRDSNFFSTPITIASTGLQTVGDHRITKSV